jgi:hypothetical protein
VAASGGHGRGRDEVRAVAGLGNRKWRASAPSGSSGLWSVRCGHCGRVCKTASCLAPFKNERG